MKFIVGKRVNKIIIGAVLGSAILGLGGYGMSPKGKGFFRKVGSKVKESFGFFRLGFSEFIKMFKKNKKK